MMRPLSVDQALEFVGILLAQPAVAIIEPGKRHFELLGRLLSMLGTAGNLTSDAHIAALAIEQDAEVYSADLILRGSLGSAGAIRWLRSDVISFPSGRAAIRGGGSSVNNIWQYVRYFAFWYGWDHWGWVGEEAD